MSAYVVDASVAAKWFLPEASEPYSDQAVKLLRQHAEGKVQLVAPDIFWPEVGNILWKSARMKRISSQAPVTAIRWLREVNLPMYPSEPLIERAISIAVAFDRSVYDAVYVALAAGSDRPLVTADQRLVNALGAHFAVRWLGAFM